MKKLRTKSAIIIFLTTIILNFCTAIEVKAQTLPTFNLMVKNYVLGDTLGGSDNVLFFDIYIHHINLATSGAFELAYNQYFLNFNPAIANGGTLSYQIVPGSTQFSNPNAVPRNPTLNLTTGILNLPTNSPIAPGDGPIISAIFPGTRVVTMRLATTASSLIVPPSTLTWRNGPTNPFTKIYSFMGTLINEITNNGTYVIDPWIPISRAYINLKVLMEGMYYPLFNLMSRKDTVNVYLRDASPPYSLRDSAKGVIDSITFSALFYFNNLPSGTCYIIIKHFNCIETWSKAGGESIMLGSVYYYDFTSSITQAYGNNLRLKGSKYCIYSGNVNQDAIIDAGDLSLVDNAVFNSVTGYVSEDVTGDYFVDADDLSIVDNNAFNGVMRITPLGDLKFIATRKIR